MPYKTPLLFAALSETSPYLNFCHAGQDTCEPGYNYGPAVRSFYLVHYVMSGKGTYTIKGRMHDVSAGQAFLIPPGESTIYQADKTDPWAYCFFAFDGKMASELIERTAFAGQNYVITLNSSEIGPLIIETAKQLLAFLI